MNGNLTALQRFFLAFVAFFYVLFNRRFAEEVQRLHEQQRALPPPVPSPAPEVGVKPGPTEAPAAPPPSDARGMPAPTFTDTGAAAPREPPPPAPSSSGSSPTPVVSSAPQLKTAAPPPAVAPVPEPRPAPAPASPAPELVALHVLGTLQRDGRLIDFLSEELTGFTDSEIGAAARTVHEGCRKTMKSYVTLEPIYKEPEEAKVTVPTGFDPATIRITGNVVGNPPFKGTLRHKGWRASRASFPPMPQGHDPHVIAPAEVELA